MSPERSSSAVRNLRSIFENKASENSPDARGRSPGLLSRQEDEKSPSPLPPRSRIRSSFVAVEARLNMSSAAEGSAGNVSQNTASEHHRESSKGLRRASFSDNKDGVAAGALRETILSEQARRNEDSSVGETIPESAIESAAPTPLVEVENPLRTSKTDKPASNPDKPVTGAEEEPAKMKPADPASEEAVSGGKALAGAEDLRKSQAKKTAKTSPAVTRSTANTNGKPPGITTKDTSKSTSNSLKSPASQSKTPVSPSSTGASQPTSAPAAKKPPRASLTAPTAASVARAAAAEKASASSKAAPKPKPREVTKTADVSRLTAPTAASRAKYEPATAAPAIPKPTTKPKTAAASSKPAPRQSLGRPDSRGSQNSATKRSGPVDSSFLERMTRPTAASSNKTQKAEPAAPKQLPQRTKPNGHPKGVKTASKDAVVEPSGDTTAIEEPSIVQEESPAAEQTEETSKQEIAKPESKSEPQLEPEPESEAKVLETKAAPAPEPAVEKKTSPPQTNGHTKEKQPTPGKPSPAAEKPSPASETAEAVKGEKPSSASNTAEAGKSEKPSSASNAADTADTVKNEKPSSAPNTAKAGKSEKSPLAPNTAEDVKSETPSSASNTVEAVKTEKLSSASNSADTVKSEKPSSAARPAEAVKSENTSSTPNTAEAVTAEKTSASNTADAVKNEKSSLAADNSEAVKGEKPSSTSEIAEAVKS